MPKHYECALMSKFVYSIGSNPDLPLDSAFSRRGWEIIGRSAQNQSGYFGVAFKKGNDIVIAHRGTESNIRENIVADFAIMSGTENTELRNLTDSCTQFILGIANRYTEEVISNTGHSLGGFLSTYSAAVLNNTYSEGDFKSVTFDSLGAGQHLQNLRIPSNEANVINYVMCPNLVNTVALQVGELRRVYNKNNDEIFEKLKTQFLSTIQNRTRTLQLLNDLGEENSDLNSNYIWMGIILNDLLFTFGFSHPMENFMAEFNKNSGNISKYGKVDSWPSPQSDFWNRNEHIERIVYPDSDEVVHAICTAIRTIIPIIEQEVNRWAELRDAHRARELAQQDAAQLPIPEEEGSQNLSRRGI